ncbi:hypothetical protein DL240_07615 [Lujinxingia litoralis]|uniref:Uncharacterized protein n=1 Tax=Lujinxingia litoralis TaxID=2211119 RepID=A0A328C7I3_9DELT|nr:hypothetical protein [Lujinxingia litoralis]RAL22758.1 hypothetical protein DL240_07615 [Lujinxingia litoralis]
MKRLATCLMLLTTLTLATTQLGCKAAECTQMVDCCKEVADLPGVGASCKGLAMDTRDPQTCRTVTRTVRYMLEDRGAEIPAVCQRP